jgi:hypothetical protein
MIATFLRTDNVVRRRRYAMRSIVLWVLGVPITVIILLNVFGLLG